MMLINDTTLKSFTIYGTSKAEKCVKQKIHTKYKKTLELV